MPYLDRHAPARPRRRRVPRPVRAVARAFQVLLVACAAAFGAPPPRLLPHDDPIAEVREDEP